MRVDFALTCLLFVFGLVVRLSYILNSGFDGLYGQDPFAYYNAGQLISTGLLPERFYFPLGYPVLLGLVGTANGQIINIILGSLLASFTYSLSRQMNINRAGAATSGLLMAICGQAAQSSLVVMADIPALTWTVLSACSLWRYRTVSRPVWLVMAFALLMLACVTRWQYLVLFALWGAVLLVNRHVHWRHFIAAGSIGLLILIPQLAYDLSATQSFNHNFVYQWSLSNAFNREFTSSEGQMSFEKVNALYNAQPLYEPYFLSPVFLPFLLVGSWAQRKNYAVIVFLSGWILASYIFLSGVPMQNIRYLIMLFPPIAILCGAGIGYVFDSKNDLSRPKSLILYAALVVVIVYGMWHTLSTSYTIIGNFIDRQQRDRLIADWVGGQLPEDACLYAFGLTLTLQHYTSLQVYELYIETPTTLDVRRDHTCADYLFLNIANIEQQWDGREPQTAYHWLRDERGLTEIGRYGVYTLYRVNR